MNHQKSRTPTFEKLRIEKKNHRDIGLIDRNRVNLFRHIRKRRFSRRSSSTDLHVLFIFLFFLFFFRNVIIFTRHRHKGNDSRTKRFLLVFPFSYFSHRNLMIKKKGIVLRGRNPSPTIFLLKSVFSL